MVHTKPTQRPVPQQKALSWDEVHEGQEYDEAQLGLVTVTAKMITRTNRRILMLNLKGRSYEYPKYFEQVSLTSTNKNQKEE
jgi:hypothetical protein